MLAGREHAAESQLGNPPVRDLLRSLRNEQRAWQAVPLAARLKTVRKLRSELACSARDLAALISPELERTPADTLTAEVAPLAEACRFLERQAALILSPRHPGNGSRPAWLRGVQLEIRREPLGLILIIGPANYPLFLPGVQALQALVAGNAVLLKPGRHAAAIARAFRLLAISSGIPAGLLQVLDEAPAAALEAIRLGVDKVILTGSLAAGEAVYREAAEHLTPAVMELSGYDPVFVLAGADFPKTIRAIIFGLKLNGGQTCIAPRRVFLDSTLPAGFEPQLAGALQAAGLARDALAIRRFTGSAEALSLASDCPFALGASVFGPAVAAAALARRIDAGVVVINDMIVPTADPRIPFGGRHLSGFGITRGAEGLLEFTATKAIALQRARRPRHFAPLPANAEDLFAAYLAASHKLTWRARLAEWRNVAAAIARSHRKDLPG